MRIGTCVLNFFSMCGKEANYAKETPYPAWRGTAPLAFSDSQSIAFMLLSGCSRFPVCDALLVRLADLQEKYDSEIGT